MWLKVKRESPYAASQVWTEKKMLPKVELTVSTTTSFDLSDEIKTNKNIQYGKPRILAKTYDEFLKLFLSNNVIDHLQV